MLELMVGATASDIQAILLAKDIDIGLQDAVAFWAEVSAHNGLQWAELPKDTGSVADMYLTWAYGMWARSLSYGGGLHVR